MRVDELNSIVPALSPRQPAGDSRAEPPPKHEEPVEPRANLSGELNLNGVTAYYEVRNGEKVIYSLVEDATGRLLGEFSPSSELGLTAALNQMQGYQTDYGDSKQKGR